MSMYKELIFLGADTTVDYGPHIYYTVNVVVFDVKGTVSSIVDTTI